MKIETKTNIIGIAALSCLIIAAIIIFISTAIKRTIIGFSVFILMYLFIGFTNIYNDLRNEEFKNENTEAWIPVTDRLPTKEEYLTVRDKDTSYYKRLLIAYQTDTIMYDIGYYDGYKWFTDKHGILHNVIAWKPFMKYKKDGD